MPNALEPPDTDPAVGRRLPRGGTLTQFHVKVNSPTGRPFTISLVSGGDGADAVEWVNAIEGLHILSELAPFYTTIMFAPKEGEGNALRRFAARLGLGRQEERCMIMRSARPHSRAPSLHVLDYISFLTFKLLEVLKNAGSTAKSILGSDASLLGGCVQGVEGWLGVNNLVKLDPGKCIKYVNQINKNIFKFILSDLTGGNAKFEPFDYNLAKLLGEKENEKEKLVEVAEMITTTLMSIFIREHVYIYRTRGGQVYTLSVDIQGSVQKGLMLGKSEAVLATLLYGSYSGISQYPFLLWYSSIFGTDPLPSAVEQFTVTSLERLGDRLVPSVRARREDYLEHMEDTLERYTRRLDLDAIHMAYSIDTYYYVFWGNPWYRAIVHDLFMKSLHRSLSGAPSAGGRGENIKYFKNIPVERTIVMPAFYPSKVVHEKVNMIYVPLKVEVPISKSLIDSIYYDLERLESQGAAEQEVARLATRLMERLDRNKDEVRHNIASTIKDILGSLESRSKCIHGVIVEVLHPVSSVVLFHEFAMRMAAQMPGPSLTVNLLKFIMEHLTGTDVFTVVPYIIINLEKLINKYRPERGVMILDSEGKNEKRIVCHSMSIEFIAKEILHEAAPSGSQPAKTAGEPLNRECIYDIHELSERIYKEVA